MNTGTGTWVPTPTDTQPDAERIRRWADHAWDTPDALAQLDDLDVVCIQRWIGLPAAAWSEVLAPLDQLQLVRLMCLFTLAEEHLQGCAAGEHSAVIHAFRAHKSRYGRPDRELVRWIKATSRNRFLPYGPAL